MLAQSRARFWSAAANGAIFSRRKPAEEAQQRAGGDHRRKTRRGPIASKPTRAVHSLNLVLNGVYREETSSRGVQSAYSHEIACISPATKSSAPGLEE